MASTLSADLAMAPIGARVDRRIRGRTARIAVASTPPSTPRTGAVSERRGCPGLRWPPWRWRESGKAQERVMSEAIRKRRWQQIDELCRAVKAECVADLQEILCSMVLSECVYKRPVADMMQHINRFKSDFGGDIIPLHRVQPSLDNVLHRYLLAEAGDTIYASFIGTKQYKDVITDANILQGAIFDDDNNEDDNCVGLDVNQMEAQDTDDDSFLKSRPMKRKRRKANLKPAAHRGFLARAKGIPALELYKLAEKKNRKLVLCGHSLGGAVAVLSTLAILRELASASPQKEKEEVQVKCITFSQPPVGNAALRDYVCQKGWQHYFKTYCIPEDLVPRILSPAYFDHYNAQAQHLYSIDPDGNGCLVKLNTDSRKFSKKPKRNSDLGLGLGPVQTSFLRLSRLVPTEAVRKHVTKFHGVVDCAEFSSNTDCGIQSIANEADEEPQSDDLQEGSGGISLTPIAYSDTRKAETTSRKDAGESYLKFGRTPPWRRVPYLPSYVPFGQLYLLGNSSVDLVSEAEYSKLTSVRSMISEIREFFQSHSMKSYRSRFKKIYDKCMCLSISSSLRIDQLPHIPHVQQLHGFTAAVEIGHIVDPPVIRTATSILPLGWSGVPAENNSQPMKVHLWGYQMHSCTHVHAQVNGAWCSTSVESIHPASYHLKDNALEPELQKLQISIGAQLKRPLKCPAVEEFLCTESFITHPDITSFGKEERFGCNDLNRLLIYCSNDFTTICKEVHVRTRRVRLLGCEGAGKTSLFRALLAEKEQRKRGNQDFVNFNVNVQQGITDGLSFLDSPGVNLQKLHLELSNFRKELKLGAEDLDRKIDLVILVHNLSHQIPWYHDSTTLQPALSLFLNEAKAHGIPWILVITNKFSVNVHQRKILISSVAEAYQASADMMKVVNTCPFVVPTASSVFQPSSSVKPLSRREAARRLLFTPINLARRSFQRKGAVKPVDGIAALRQLVHCVLAKHEETALQELADRSLSLELAREQSTLNGKAILQGKGSSIAVVASLRAGVGFVVAAVMDAASAMRKP